MDDGLQGVYATRFSTAAFRKHEATSAWREIFGRTILGIDITPLAEEFRAEADAFSWPGFGVIYAATSAVHNGNSRALIASDDLSFGTISFMSGPTCKWRASQLGRTADLECGDGVLMSNAEVGSITLFNDCRFATFCIPSSVLEPLVPDMELAFGRRVPAASPAMRMLSRYIELGREPGALATPELQNAFARHVADLLALALGASRDAMQLARSRGVRAARLHAIKQDIQKALSRPDLSVNHVAAWHQVTPRYVQMLFNESGSSFTRFLQEQRLELVYRMLTSSAGAELPITTIAYDCGFSDLSSFNRAFRRQFGCTPRDVRMAAQASRESHAP
jgi:AraC-like DNA-binding protein